MVSGVGWTPSNELYLVSDDRRVRRWSLSTGHGEVGLTSVVEVDYYVTCMRWLNSVKGGQLSTDCLALACSDGAVRLMTANGRVERVIASAHVGSVLCVEWSADGASLLTGGEDGLVKQWSRSGHLRSKLAAVAAPVTSLAWSPDGEKFAFTSARTVSIQFTASNGVTATSTSASASSSSAHRQWTAHTSAVLCCDWHPMTGQLLTGGEDGVYRLWTEEGELVFASRPFDFPVSAVKWSPSGLHFAAGAFNLIALCDAAGWAYSRHRCHTGTLTCLDWMSDGTHLSGGGSNGTLLIAQLIERHKDWQHFHCRLTEKNSLAIFDLSVGSGGGGGKEGQAGGVESLVHMEELDFTSPVIDWSVGHGMLVVTTATSCQIFTAPHFASAALIELRGGGAVELILQAERHFALVDSIKGVLLYTYEGKLLQTVRLPPSVPLSSLHSSTVQMTGDLLVVASKASAVGGGGSGGGVVWVLDAVQGGRKVCEPIRHPQELSLLTVSASAGPGGQRQLAFIDRNRDLYTCQLTTPSTSHSNSTSTASAPSLVPVRLSSNVEHCRWNDSYEVLATIGEGQVRCFFLPLAPAIDPDCTPHTITHLLSSSLPPPPPSGVSLTSSSSSASSLLLGNRSSLSSFSLSRLTVRSSSGTVIALSVSAFPLFLHRCAAKGEWSRALRLCRLLSSSDEQRLCWAVLYGLSVQAGQLDLAQQSAAKLDWAEKVRSLQQMQAIPSEAGRRGALAAYQRQFDLAESIFLSAQLPYRAIAMRLQRCHWLKALTLARKCNCHVDTVLLARRQHLLQLRQHGTKPQQEGGGEGEVEESLEEFRAMAQVQVSVDAVAAKIAAELTKERSRGQAYPTSVRSHTQHLLDKFTGVEEGGLGGAGPHSEGAGKWQEEEKQRSHLGGDRSALEL